MMRDGSKPNFILLGIFMGMCLGIVLLTFAALVLTIVRWIFA